MIQAVLMLATGFTLSAILGGLAGTWWCSRQRWCPRHMQRQLDAWRRQMTRQNAERQRSSRSQGTDAAPPEGDRAA